MKSVAPRRRPRTLLVNVIVLAAQGLSPLFILLFPAVVLSVPFFVVFASLLAALYVCGLRWSAPSSGDEARRVLITQIAGHALFPVIIATVIAWSLLILGGFVALILHGLYGGPLPGGLGVNWQVEAAIQAAFAAAGSVCLAGLAWSIWLLWLGRVALVDRYG